MSTRHTPTPDSALMLLTISSGAVDAISFITFGKVFTAFMTGNFVFLGLAATHAFEHGGPSVLRVCLVLVAFAGGAFLAARIMRRFRRSWLRDHGVAVTLSGVLVVEVIFLAGWIAVGGDPGDSAATALAIVLALAMGMQTAAVGALDIKSVFTTAVTATFLNLAREAADRKSSGTDPARLAKIVVSLIAGAAAGGLLIVHAPEVAGVLPPVATALALAVGLRGELRGGSPATAGDGSIVVEAAATRSLGSARGA